MRAQIQPSVRNLKIRKYGVFHGYKISPRLTLNISVDYVSLYVILTWL